MNNSIDQLTFKHRELLATLPNQPLIQGILERRHPYEILITHPDFVFIKSNATFAYLAGRPNIETLHEIVELLSDYKKIVLICSESVQPFFSKHGYRLQPRMSLKIADAIKPPYKITPSSDYHLQAIDTMNIFARCLWFKSIASFYGSAQNFLDHGFGLVLINDAQQIIAEAYAVSIGNGLCEIGVVTHPDFQGKGYCTIAVQHFIDECARRNLTAVWSCNCDNIASWKVAIKTNFEITKYYAFMIKAARSSIEFAEEYI